MKLLLLAALALPWADAPAQSYTCPAEDAGTPLSNAQVWIGQPDTPYALHGDVHQVKEGTDIRYGFPDGVPRWLVCQYGGKRVDGTAISGAEMTGARQIRIPMDPLVDTCDVTLRTKAIKGKNNRAWTALAICKQNKPPPADMM